MKTRSHGFSLIELLVAVAVVLILAALLISGMRDYQTHALRQKCAATLRGYAYGFTSYETDNEGFLPPGKITSSVSTSNLDSVGWEGPMRPYMEVSPGMPLPRCSRDGNRREGTSLVARYGAHRGLFRHIRVRHLAEEIARRDNREAALLVCHHRSTFYSHTHIRSSVNNDVHHGNGRRYGLPVINILFADLSVESREMRPVATSNSQPWGPLVYFDNLFVLNSPWRDPPEPN